MSFAVLLLFYRVHGRFPHHASEIETEAIAAVARQIDVPIVSFDVLDMSDRALKRHCAEIRTILGFREAIVTDGEALTEWLNNHAVADNRDMVELVSALKRRCRFLKSTSKNCRIDFLVSVRSSGYIHKIGDFADF